MIRMLGGLLRQLQPIEPNPFSSSLLDELIGQFGLWEIA